MNPDDPKFTAYALDELDPAEHAEIEQLLRENPEAAAEVEATRAFAAQLRTRLQAEPAQPLRAAQRDEILANLAPAAPRKVIAFSPKAALWTALAASVALVIGLLALFPAIPAQRVAFKSAPNNATDPTDATRAAKKEKEMLGRELAALPALQSPAPPPAEISLSEQVVAPAQSASADGNARLALAAAALPAPEPSLVLDSQPPATPPLFVGGTSGTAGTSTLAKDMTRSDVLARGSLAPSSAAAPAKPGSMSGRMGGTSRVLEQQVALETKHRVRVIKADSAAPFDRGLSMHLEGEVGRGDSEFSARYKILEDSRPNPSTAESYDDVTDNAFLKVGDAPLSTFSIDVDTASYANVRRFLNGNSLPPKAAVRIEELVNYFNYDYPQPDGDAPFSAAMEVAACPWAPEHRLLRVALHGRDIHRAERRASNLVFLIDVSGSMQPENKLPLLKRSLQLMVDQLGERDRVAIVVYAGAAGCVLDSTTNKERIRAALDRLESGGSTHGSAGLQLAYDLAEKHFIKGATNRVILATDGDWNVGVTDKGELWSMIERKAKSGVFLTVLGFGMGNLKDGMLEKLADKGNGNYAYIDTLNEGRKVLVEELGATLVTIAKDVKIQVEFNPAQVGAYRLIGYENRVLAAKDFNDDTKDAGEIGAGHSVTAFYELIPAGQAMPAPSVEPLKYQPAIATAAPKPDIKSDKPAASDELLTLKLRYKAPDGDTSTLREFPLKDGGHDFAQSTRDFRFAAAVATYGMLLRQSPHRGSANWELVHELATEGKGEDRDGYRTEFIGLVEKARALMR